MTTKAELTEWFDRGVGKGADYMIVVCDTFDWEDYPVFVTGENIAEKVDAERNKPMQKVMEVYDLKADRGEQMNEARAWRAPA